jgi:glucosyl-3-phosphoglycerate synthase
VTRNRATAACAGRPAVRPATVAVVDRWPGIRRFRGDVPAVTELVSRKAGRRLAVCIPARDEERTVGPVVRTVRQVQAWGLVDDLIVVDDHSSDATASRAMSAGATVVTSRAGPGKGQALARAVEATDAEVLLFLDADVTSLSPGFVAALVAPALADDTIQLVKAAYRRPLGGIPDEGGRVTELLARPLLRRFFPELSVVSQPLAGECAVRRDALDGITFADGYGIEIGLLIDVYRRHGVDAIAEVELGERVHRNHPLLGLRPHADAVLDAVLARTGGH